MHKHPRVVFTAISHTVLSRPAGSLRASELDKCPKHREMACLSAPRLEFHALI